MIGNKFWFGYMAFFVFVFPMFFSYTGRWLSSPMVATISLAAGAILWGIFIFRTFRQTVATPLKMRKEMYSTMSEGELRQATVLNKTLRKKMNNGFEMIEIVVGFENLSRTDVKYSFAFIDTKPYLQRYKQGRHINLRLSKTGRSPAITMADATVQFDWKTGLFACFFLVIYMVGTFAFHYYKYSNGHGWRFLSLWHPWLMTPVMGLFCFNLGNVLGKLFGGNPKIQEMLILRGKKAMAKVQSANQTGTMINEQPQIKFILEFTDDKGDTHVVSIRKIVLLTELYLVNEQTKEILYLPENPQQITFL